MAHQISIAASSTSSLASSLTQPIDERTTLKALLYSEVGEKLVLQSLTVQTLLSDDLDFLPMITAGPEIVRAVGLCFLVARGTVAGRTRLRGERGGDALQFDGLKENVEHCAGLSRWAFRDVERNVSDIKRVIKNTNDEFTRLNNMLEVIERDESASEESIPGQLVALLQFSRDLVQLGEKMTGRLVTWKESVDAVMRSVERENKRLIRKGQNQTVPRVARLPPTSTVSSDPIRSTTDTEQIASIRENLSKHSTFFIGSFGLNLHQILNPDLPDDEDQLDESLKTLTLDPLPTDLDIRTEAILSYISILERKKSTLLQRSQTSKHTETLTNFSTLAPSLTTLTETHQALHLLSTSLGNFIIGLTSLTHFFTTTTTTLESLITPTSNPPPTINPLTPLTHTRLTLLTLQAHHSLTTDLLSTYTALSTLYTMPSLCALTGHHGRPSKPPPTPPATFAAIAALLEKMERDYRRVDVDGIVHALVETWAARVGEEVEDLRIFLGLDGDDEEQEKEGEGWVDVAGEVEVEVEVDIEDEGCDQVETPSNASGVSVAKEASIRSEVPGVVSSWARRFLSVKRVPGTRVVSSRA